MNAKKVILGTVLLGVFIASAVQVLASDNFPIFNYKKTVKGYDEAQDRVVSHTYNAYIVVDRGTGLSPVVWYWGTGAGKVYWVEYDVPLRLKCMDVNGTALLTAFESNVGFGKIKISSIDSAIVSCSIIGTMTSFEPAETGTFSFKYNNALTKKAMAGGLDALDQVIADLTAKHYNPSGL